MERFHRVFQTNYREYIREFSKQRDKLQREIIERAGRLQKKKELVKWAVELEKEFVEKWEKLIVPGRLPFLYGMKWRKINESAWLR